LFYLFLFYHLTMDKVKISSSVKCKAPSLELFIISPISLITSFRRRRWCSSVSIISDYRLNDWYSISGRGKGFFR
jgi:hypothetical protein